MWNYDWSTISVGEEVVVKSLIEAQLVTQGNGLQTEFAQTFTGARKLNEEPKLIDRLFRT